MTRVVDHTRFAGRAGIISWAAAQESGRVGPKDEYDDRDGFERPHVHLRWAFKPELGYPLEPFVVWARATKPEPDTGVGLTILGNGRYLLDAAYDDLYVELDGAGAGSVLAFGGMPLVAPLCAQAGYATGQTTVRLSGSGMRVVWILGGSGLVQVQAVTGAADDPAWDPVEIVGLPGDGRSSARTDLLTDQGLIGNPLPPVDAAIDRFQRGAPYAGWLDQLPDGNTVPPWRLADPKAIIALFQAELLPRFIDMVDTAATSSAQCQTMYSEPLAGQGQTASATFNPLAMLLYGALSDPLEALLLGFGTAFPAYAPLEGIRTTMAATNRRGLDFMVTGTFLDDLGNKVERAALMLNPGPLTGPPTPAAIQAVSPGLSSPTVIDDDYRAVVSVSWQAPSALFGFAVGSHALARNAIDPVTAPELLMEPRPGDTALQPLGASRNDTQPLLRSLSDTSWAVDSGVVPNQLRYAVSAQDIFGLWSSWAQTGVTVAEPAVNKVSVTAAQLVTGVATGACPASVTFDLTWDWSARSPRDLTVTAARYAQSWPEDPPASTSAPGGNTFASTGSGQLVAVSFDATGQITSTTPGAGLSATVAHLSLDGQHEIAAPLTNASTRRYRVTVNGFDLDFPTASRWGVALWARGVEARAPQRVGAWSQPVVVSAADPRPPVIVSSYDDVLLASMRDHDGLHHARLSWSPMSGATSYQVYSCTESALRAFHGLPEPSYAETLRQRLTTLQQTFAADPERRPFTRLGGPPVTGTSTQVTLPRGTKEIHCFVVLGVSGGNVESAWPTSADPQCGKRFVPFAAPVVVAPPAPALEVRQVEQAGAGPTAYAAAIRVTPAPDAAVGKVEIHRVRVPAAADAVETMGPPVHSITGSAGGFTVTGSAHSPIELVTGTDAPDGSWRPVTYRAVAWGLPDPSRGQYAGRSPASVSRSVVVPPAGGPPLDSPAKVLPVAGSSMVRIDSGTTAPVADTVLGPHVFSAQVSYVDATGASTEVPLSVGNGTLSALPDAPPATPDSGVWREATAAGHTPLHLLVRRTDPALTVRVTLRLTDPLGRITEKVIDVPPGVAPPSDDWFVHPVVGPIHGGWTLSFGTDLPNTVDGGAVVLTAALARRGVATVEVSSALADLVPPGRGVLVPLDPPLFPGRSPRLPLSGLHLFATRRADGTRTIGVFTPWPGRMTVTLAAPDGTSSSLTRLIESLP